MDNETRTKSARHRHWLPRCGVAWLYLSAGWSVAGVDMSSASAQATVTTPAETYRHLIEEALQEYDRGNWDEAAVLFERAHQLSPSARTLRGLGLAAFEARRYVDAITHLNAALVDTRRELTPAQHVDVARTLERANSFVARYEFRAVPASAEILINGRRALRNQAGEVLIDPGVVELEVTAEGYEPVLRRVQAVAAHRETLLVTLRALAEPAAPASDSATPLSADLIEPESGTRRDAPDDGSSLPTLKWALGAAALAALAAGGVALIVQKVEADKFNRACVPGMLTPGCQELSRSVGGGGPWYTAAIVGFSVGAGLAATSAVLFWLDSTGRRKRPEIAANGCAPAWIAPAPGDIGVMCRFAL